MEQVGNSCKNCGESFENTQKFCPNCGQNTKLSKLTVKELFVNLFHTVFNYDNTLLNTIKIIFRPWAYTEQYIAGKRKSYMNPIRIFILLMIIFIGIMLSNLHINNIPAKKLMEIESDLSTSFDQTISRFDLDEQDCAQLDTLKRAVFANALMSNDISSSNLLEVGISEYKITRYDALHLTPDEIIEKYKITNFFKKRFLIQFLKIKDEQEGGLKYAIGNVVWGMCVTIFLLAALFKLLYIRNKRFYIEHIVLILNVHVIAIFIAIIIAILFKIVDTQGDGYVYNSMMSLLITLPIFMFLSLYFYYKQSIWKTFLKFIFIMFNYVSFGLIIILLTSIVSLLFY